MEPDSIEKLIKDTLAERALEPTLQARERFIDGLNEKPKKKDVLWLKYGIAAILLLSLCIAGFQTFSNDINSIDPTNVSFQNEKPEVEVNTITIPSDTSNLYQKDIKKLNNKEDANSSIIKTNTKALVSNVSSNKNLANSEIKDHTANKTSTINELDAKAVLNSIKNDSSFSKLSIKSDPVEKLNQDQFSYVTALELLAEVDSDTTKALINKTKKLEKSYVNSDMLLLEMERQLFNEKNKNIFKKAAKQLKKLKTTLAYRNLKN